MKLAIATQKNRTEPDPDEELFLEHFAKHFEKVELVEWNGIASHDFKNFDFMLLRSTWDYFLAPESFLKWCEAVEQNLTLRNSLEAIKFSLDKARYFDFLVKNNVCEIIPTEVISKNTGSSISNVRKARNWSKIVLKPAISANSFRTRFFSDSESAEAESFLNELLEGESSVLCQPFIEPFLERAHVWIAGTHTHYVEKEPRFQGQEEKVSDARQPDDYERELVRNIIDNLPHEIRAGLLYARVDLVQDPDNTSRWLLSELELIEPSLFLLQHQPALDLLTEAIKTVYFSTMVL